MHYMRSLPLPLLSQHCPFTPPAHTPCHISPAAPSCAMCTNGQPISCASIFKASDIHTKSRWRWQRKYDWRIPHARKCRVWKTQEEYGDPQHIIPYRILESASYICITFRFDILAHIHTQLRSPSLKSNLIKSFVYARQLWATDLLCVWSSSGVWDGTLCVGLFVFQCTTVCIRRWQQRWSQSQFECEPYAFPMFITL